MRHVPALVMAFLVLAVLYAPAVLGAETRTITGFLRLDDDAPFDPNMTFNLSDPANLDLLNWNQTVEGFQDTSGLIGSFTGPYLPPIEVLAAVNRNDVQTLTVCGKVRFKTEWVMSGSSESWWRVPERGPYYGDNVNLTIWRVGSPDLLNFTDALVPNTASHPTTVFNYSYDLDTDEFNETFRWYNTTAWDHTFNSTWVRVVAPIHGDDFYAVRWEMTNRSTWAEHWLRFSQNDIGDDRDFSTWLFYPNNTREFIGADLDFSVIHTEGHGYSVWGHEIITGIGEYAPTDKDEITESIHPTGTEGGLGTWDGDWSSGWGTATQTVDNNDYMVGTQSIKHTVTVAATIHGPRYIPDTAPDLTDYTHIRFYMKIVDATIIDIKIWISKGTLGGTDDAYIAFTGAQRNLVDGDWGYIDVKTSDFVTEVDFDWSIWSRLLFYVQTSVSETPSIWVDGYHFANATNETEPQLTWYTELEEPITIGDYLTVMVPFLETVDNSTNVLITFGTQNDSWATGFWAAENGPTDFALKSVQWDVGWEATEMKVSMTIYNTTRRLWVMDRNTLNDPDLTWAYNRYSVDDHAWAPDDYYFGGVPYHAMQITNGSWENAITRPVFYVGGRELRPDQFAKQSEHSDDWYVEVYLEGYEGVNRVIISIGFALHGDWGKASDALNPEVPFPTDAGWFYGKYIFPAVWALNDFLGGIGARIWSALVWIWEGLQWIVANAGWVIAGTLRIITFFLVVIIWGRFYRVLQGLIRFGWTIADKGLVAGGEFANEFWSEYIASSPLKKAITRGRGGA